MLSSSAHIPPNSAGRSNGNASVVEDKAEHGHQRSDPVTVDARLSHARENALVTPKPLKLQGVYLQLQNRPYDWSLLHTAVQGEMPIKVEDSIAAQAGVPGFPSCQVVDCQLQALHRVVYRISLSFEVPQVKQYIEQLMLLIGHQPCISTQAVGRFHRVHRVAKICSAEAQPLVMLDQPSVVISLNTKQLAYRGGGGHWYPIGRETLNTSFHSLHRATNSSISFHRVCVIMINRNSDIPHLGLAQLPGDGFRHKRTVGYDGGGYHT